MRSRRGFTLVEVLIVVTVGTAIFGVSMSVLYLLKQTRQTLAERGDQQRTVARLAEQFREDVHSAREVTRPDGAAAAGSEGVWELPCDPDTTVRYELRGNIVRRSRMHGKEGDAIGDDFRLPAGMRATIRLPETASMLVTLRLESTGRTSERRPVQVDAVLGLTRRHARTPRTGDTQVMAE